MLNRKHDSTNRVSDGRSSELSELVSEVKTLNTQLAYLEAHYGVAKTASTPPHLEIDFLSECNLRCFMCHQSKQDMGGDRLTAVAIEALIDSFPLVDSVMIAGLGEPLLHKRIGHILPFLARYQCRSHLFTNGMLIDRRLEVLGHLDRLSISFDSDNKKNFERLRARSDFHKLLSNIEQLRVTHPDLELVTSTVVSHANVSEVAGIVRLAARLGFDEVHLSPVDHTPKLQLRAGDEAIFKSQLAEAASLALSLGIEVRSNLSKGDFRGLIASSDSSPSTMLNTPSAESPAADQSKSEPGNDEHEHEHEQQSKCIQHLSSGEELRELERRKGVLGMETAALLASSNAVEVTTMVPSCTAPWLYGFARSNSSARLCPFADIDVGGVSKLYSTGYNSMLLEAVRSGFAREQPHLAVCRSCTDSHREFRITELNEFLRGRIELKNER